MQRRSIAMTTTALSALLLALSASLVSAAPEDKETTERVSYSGKAQDAAADEAWVELASPTPASHGREFIQLDEDAGPFVRLRIDAVAGRPTIRTVRISYRDGKQRVVRIDKVLSAKPAVIDLGGPKRIERLVVVTEGSKKMTYSVRGERVRNSVAAR
jgi:hypothetical protein